MKKLIFFVLCVIPLPSQIIAQCNCYTVEDLNIAGQDSMELVLSNTCDNNVYLNLYVISSLSPFDTIAKQELFNAFILPLDTHVSNILETTATELPAAGSYRVSITNGTINCDSLQLSGSLNSIQNQSLLELKIQPNPFAIETNVQLENHIEQGNLVVYDYNGKIVKEVYNFSGQNVKLDLSHLSSGMYFLHIIQDHQLIAKEPLLIQNQ